MKVYVITKGDYSDYGICAVATDRETAEKLQIKYSDCWDGAEIEEYDTDHDVSGDFDKIYWNVQICCNGDSDAYGYTSGGRPHINFHNNGLSCGACVIAKTKEQALKIVYDKRAEYIALQNQRTIIDSKIDDIINFKQEDEDDN